MANISIDKTKDFIRVLPDRGYKLKKKGDNTQSFSEIDLPFLDEQAIEEYIAVPETEADEIVEVSVETPTEADEISDADALVIITGGGTDDKS